MTIDYFGGNCPKCFFNLPAHAKKMPFEEFGRPTSEKDSVKTLIDSIRSGTSHLYTIPPGACISPQELHHLRIGVYMQWAWDQLVPPTFPERSFWTYGSRLESTEDVYCFDAHNYQDVKTLLSGDIDYEQAMIRADSSVPVHILANIAQKFKGVLIVLSLDRILDVALTKAGLSFIDPEEFEDEDEDEEEMTNGDTEETETEEEKDRLRARVSALRRCSLLGRFPTLHMDEELTLEVVHEFNMSNCLDQYEKGKLSLPPWRDVDGKQCAPMACGIMVGRWVRCGTSYAYEVVPIPGGETDGFDDIMERVLARLSSEEDESLHKRGAHWRSVWCNGTTCPPKEGQKVAVMVQIYVTRFTNKTRVQRFAKHIFSFTDASSDPELHSSPSTHTPTSRPSPSPRSETIDAGPI